MKDLQGVYEVKYKVPVKIDGLSKSFTTEDKPVLHGSILGPKTIQLFFSLTYQHRRRCRVKCPFLGSESLSIERTSVCNRIILSTVDLGLVVEKSGSGGGDKVS